MYHWIGYHADAPVARQASESLLDMKPAFPKTARLTVYNYNFKREVVGHSAVGRIAKGSSYCPLRYLSKLIALARSSVIYMLMQLAYTDDPIEYRMFRRFPHATGFTQILDSGSYTKCPLEI